MHFVFVLHFLLIDDEVAEKELIDAKLQAVFGEGGYGFKHVLKASDAIKCLLTEDFDFILLDNNLAASISGRFSVPVIRQHLRGSNLIVISNNVDVDYLKDPSILGVDGIVDKANFESFVTQFRDASSVRQTIASQTTVDQATDSQNINRAGRPDIPTSMAG
jgi:DNA-binding NtrC family response regulator